MFRFIRRLVQKLKRETKVETQVTSSHNNGNAVVVGSQSPASTEATFANCKQPFPIDIELYANYRRKSKEFDNRFGLLVKKKWLTKNQYEVSRHYFALGTFD